MAPIRAYHRPDSVESALDLLARPDVLSAVLGGGTVLNAGTHTADELIDLQALGLDSIEWKAPRLRYGATGTLRDLVDHEMTPPFLRDLAMKEAPNTIRNAATVGGTVATTDPESVVVAGLLACGATVDISGPGGVTEAAIDEVVADRSLLAGKIITAVSVGIDGVGAYAGTARTPADTPIVLVVGHRSSDGEVCFAATGLSDRPIVFNPAAVDDLDPPADFRGSSDYRRALAKRLSERVMANLDDGSAS